MRGLTTTNQTNVTFKRPSSRHQRRPQDTTALRQRQLRQELTEEFSIGPNTSENKENETQMQRPQSSGDALPGGTQQRPMSGGAPQRRGQMLGRPQTSGTLRPNTPGSTTSSGAQTANGRLMQARAAFKACYCCIT